MKHSKSVINKTSAFQLKGSLLTFTVLQLLQPESEIFAQQLAQLVTNTPNFFRNAPVIIDLEKLAHCQTIIDFGHLKTELVKHSIIPVGVRNGNEEQTQAALTAGLGVLNAATEKHKEPSAKGDKNITSKLITQPVRSGQQIYAQNSDLIVLSSASAGAEILADGNIHIYGALRGRALAGISGNTQAQIFCTKIEAELISIAGIYKLRDALELPEGMTGAHIFLLDDMLQINPI